MSSRTAARQRGAGTIEHFKSTWLDVIRSLLCVACGLCVTVGASAWEIATDITAAPLIRGTPAIVQFDRHWPDFSPGAPLRDLRFKGPGLLNNFSKDESEKMCDQLIGRYGDLRRFQLAGVAFDRQPVYFAHLRFFLVSLDPPIMATIPHVFALKHPEADIKNRYLYEEVNTEYGDLYAPVATGGIPRPQSLLSHMTHWINDAELSAVLPQSDGIELMSTLWPGRLTLQAAMADPQFPLTVAPSDRFPGFVEFRKK